MHVSPPLPEKPRTIYPSWPRRVAFRLLGWTAVLVRGCMWIPRSIASIREPRRPLLIVEPYGMGDALLLQPLIRAWLDTGRTVTLAARPAWKPLFPAHPHFRFLPFEPAWARTDAARKYRHPLRDVRDAVSVLYSAARGADVIEPRGDVRALLVLHLAGAARVFTLERYFSANDCRVPFLAGIRAPVRRDVTRRVLSAAWLPPGAPDERVSLAHLRPAAAKAPRKPSRRIGLIPSTTWRGKRWPDEHWRALVPRLRERGWDPVWLCGPGPRLADRFTVGRGAGCLCRRHRRQHRSDASGRCARQTPHRARWSLPAPPVGARKSQRHRSAPPKSRSVGTRDPAWKRHPFAEKTDGAHHPR